MRAYAVIDKNQSLAGAIEARKLVDEALRREPDLEPAFIARAWFSDYENDVDPKPDHDRIVREFDESTGRAISLDPSDPVAWQMRSFALIYLGRWDAALEASAMQIKLDPDDPDSYVARAWVMNMTGRPGEAVKLVERALAMNTPNICSGRSLSSSKRGRRQPRTSPAGTHPSRHEKRRLPRGTR